MKFLNLVFLGAVLGGAALVSAQTTTVSGTVVDTDGTTWANGTVSVQFLPNPSQPNVGVYNINGVPLTPAVLNQGPISLGSLGTFLVNVYTTSAITPVGSSWQYTICPNASSKCGVFSVAAVGATQNLTSTITPAIPAPRFLAIAGAYGYVNIETILQQPVGGTYWNVTSQTQLYWTGTAWVAPGSGTSFLPIAGGTLTGPLVGTTANFTTSVDTPNVNGVLYSSDFAGTDIGAQLGAAIAFWQTNGGPCYIIVSNPGTISTWPDIPKSCTVVFARGVYTTTVSLTLHHFGTMLEWNNSTIDDSIAGGAPVFDIGKAAAQVGPTGVVNTSGTAVTWVSGVTFTGLIPGNYINLGGITANSDTYIVQSVTDAHDLVLTTSAGTQTGVSLTLPGTVLTNGTTTVTYVSGPTFADIDTGDQATIGGVAYNIASVTPPLTLTTTSPVPASASASFMVNQDAEGVAGFAGMTRLQNVVIIGGTGEHVRISATSDVELFSVKSFNPGALSFEYRGAISGDNYQLFSRAAPSGTMTINNFSLAGFQSGSNDNRFYGGEIVNGTGAGSDNTLMASGQAEFYGTRWEGNTNTNQIHVTGGGFWCFGCFLQRNGDGTSASTQVFFDGGVAGTSSGGLYGIKFEDAGPSFGGLGVAVKFVNYTGVTLGSNSFQGYASAVSADTPSTWFDSDNTYTGFLSGPFVGNPGVQVGQTNLAASSIHNTMPNVPIDITGSVNNGTALVARAYNAGSGAAFSTIEFGSSANAVNSAISGQSQSSTAGALLLQVDVGGILTTVAEALPSGVFNALNGFSVGGVAVLPVTVTKSATTPVINTAACIKTVGPPVVIGYCSTALTGAPPICTCN